MDWVWSNLPQIWDLTLAHIGLSIPAIVLGFVISVPLGYWASRSRAARAVLLSAANIAYTIPAIALVVFVPVLIGARLLDPKNVIVGVTVYAVAVMVRSAADAFASVSDATRQSAVAQGFAPFQRFLRVELPLAGPVLLAGIRVVSVSTISLVTIGAFIGVDSLGSLFIDGFNRSFPTESATGIIVVLILAAVFDVVIARIGALLMPWTTGRAGRITTGKRPERAAALDVPGSGA